MRLRRSATVLATLALVSTVSRVAPAQVIDGTRDMRAQRVDSVFAGFDHTDTPGCAVGVYQRDSILYARGYGMANLELGVPITPRTMFDVGSLSKEFTAMSILLLQQQGKLSIDDPVRKYIPELPPYANQITLRELLSHTSGIRDYFTLMSIAGTDFDGTADSVDALRFITHSTEANFEPGTRYLYSNSGFVLLATVVYRVSGEPLARFAAEHVFGPLGMHATRIKNDHTMIIPNRAEAYSRRGKQGYRVEMSEFDQSGDAGVHTNVEEFLLWLRNFDNPVVGGEAAVTAMTTPTLLKNGTPLVASSSSSYGLGLTVGTYRGLHYFGHAGSWAGYRANFIDFPSQHLAVATFCNYSASGPDSLARKTAGIYLEREMAVDSAAMWRASLAGAPREAPGAGDLKALVGVWQNVDLGEVRRTQLDGDTLVLDAGRHTTLVSLGDRRFRIGDNSEITFEGDSAGAPNRLVVHTAASSTVFTRAAEWTPSAAQLAAYVGSYRTPEVGVTYILSAEHDSLVVTRDGRRAGALSPTYPDGFVSGTGGEEFDFTRNAKGRLTGFLIESGRVRHLRFVKEK